MRGIFFQQPLEYRLEVEGDEWLQGDEVICKLTLKNRGSTKVTVQQAFLHLALAPLKKVKEKSADAFEILASAEIPESIEIDAASEVITDWTFPLDVNCFITEKAKSLFLVCGTESLDSIAGHLQLTIRPHVHVDAVTSLFEPYFSFVLKGQKSKKDWVESKLIPPSGSRFASLEQVLLHTRFEGDKLQLKYIFKRNKLGATADSMSITKTKKELMQEFERNQYILPGNFVDNDLIQNAIGTALETVASTL